MYVGISVTICVPDGPHQVPDEVRLGHIWLQKYLHTYMYPNSQRYFLQIIAVNISLNNFHL